MVDISKIDWAKFLPLITEIVGAFGTAVNLNPILLAGVAGLQAAIPYAQSIIDIIKSGREPTPEEWATLRANLNAGSAELAAAAAAAQRQIDRENTPVDQGGE